MTLLSNTIASADSGDIKAGEARAAVCASCHGASGIASNPAWPNLAGQNYKYLVKQIRDFRDGTRKDAVMSPMAVSLTDQDIVNLAVYYSGL